MRWLVLICVLLSLLPPVIAQEAANPAVILIEGQNTDQPHPRTVYQVELTGEALPLFILEPDQQINIYSSLEFWLSGGQIFDLQTHELSTVIIEPSTPSPTPVLPQIQSVARPYFADVQLPNIDLMMMSGAQDTFVNVYALQNGEVQQLTNVISLFPDVVEPILSASVNIISLNPEQTGFLYRARLRDAAGTDHNALYFYDAVLAQSIKMPYFGTDPVFSPEGTLLAGSRLGALENGRPIYQLWLVNLETGEESMITQGCNPQWSPDGVWLAYEVHDNAQWSGYTDCFVNGEVAVYELASGEITLLTETLDGFVRLFGWLKVNRQP